MTSTYERRWAILAVILAAECMDLLDSTIVNVAAPSIHNNLNTSASGLQWVVGGYSLALAVGLITGGRLGDLFGRRRMFLAGAAGFTLFSVLCGLAPSTGLLITFRLLQGLASAVMLPQGFGVIREVFPAEEQSKAFGIFGPVIGSAAVVGPTLGGALIAANLFGTGWRLVFFVNLPVGIAAVAGAWRLLPHTAPEQRARLDLGGTLLSAAASLALIYPLIQGHSLGWPAWTFVLIGTSVVLFAVFGVQQRRRTAAGTDPLVLTTVFRSRGYSAGLVVLLVFFAGMGGMLLVMSLFLQVGHGFSAIHAGATFIPMSVGIAVGAGLSGGLLGPKFGRLVIQAGGAVSLAGWLIVLIAVHDHTSIGFVDLLPGLAVTGLGMGLIVAPLFDIVLAAVSDDEAGSASGLLNAVQQLAGALGVAVIGTVFFSSLGSGDFRLAIERTLWIQVGTLAAVIGLSTLMPKLARETPAEPVPGTLLELPIDVAAQGSTNQPVRSA